MWGEQHGQIIGLKKKEREAAEQRGSLERSLRFITKTLRTDPRLLLWPALLRPRSSLGRCYGPDGIEATVSSQLTSQPEWGQTLAMEAFKDIIDLAPGVQGITYDMALRGTHLERLMTDLGVLGITKVAARRRHARTHQKGGRREPKEAVIDVKEVKLLDGTPVQIRLVARDGALGIKTLDDTGADLFLPLKCLRIQRQTSAAPHRFYAQFQLPHEYHPKPITVRLNAQKGDKARGLNRAEVLRAIPFSDPDFRELYGHRADAESIHRGLEDTFYWQRSHSAGHRRQEVDLLGFGLLTNALSLARHRERERLKAAA